MTDGKEIIREVMDRHYAFKRGNVLLDPQFTVRLGRAQIRELKVSFTHGSVVEMSLQCGPETIMGHPIERVPVDDLFEIKERH